MTAHFHDTLKWITTSAGSGSGTATALRGLAGRIGTLLPEIAGVLIFGILAFVGIKHGRNHRRWWHHPPGAGVFCHHGHPVEQRRQNETKPIN